MSALESIEDIIYNENANYMQEFRDVIGTNQCSERFQHIYANTIFDFESPFILLRYKLQFCVDSPDIDKTDCLLQLRIEAILTLVNSISRVRTRLGNTEKEAFNLLSAFYECFNKNEYNGYFPVYYS